VCVLIRNCPCPTLSKKPCQLLHIGGTRLVLQLQVFLLQPCHAELVGRPAQRVTRQHGLESLLRDLFLAVELLDQIAKLEDLEFCLGSPPTPRSIKVLSEGHLGAAWGVARYQIRLEPREPKPCRFSPCPGPPKARRKWPGLGLWPHLAPGRPPQRLPK
jgi:hypothetical protein